MKKEGASSKVQREQAREVQKLKRVRASLQFERQLEGRRYRWFCELKPLKRRCQADEPGGKTQERHACGSLFAGHRTGKKP